jgi:hypothetical protein
MEIIYVFDVHLTVRAKQSDTKSSILEVKTELDAVGPIFNAWYDSDRLPTVQGNNAIAEACVVGLVSAVQSLATEANSPIQPLLEFFLFRAREMANSIDTSGPSDEFLQLLSN